MSHVFGFIGYGILVFGYEVGATARWALKPVDRVSGRFVVAGAQALPALFLGLYFRMSNIAGATNTTIFGSVPEKFSALLSPLLFPGTWWVVGLVVLSPVAGLALFRRLRFAPSIWPALLVTLAIALCTPHILFNLWGADLRIPMILATATIGSISFRHEHDYAWKTMFLALLVIVVSIRSSDVFLMLRQLDRQVASVRATLNGLPEGARLLVVDVGPDAAGRRAPAEMTGHLGLLAAIDRDAFVPFLFTGVTPVELTPSYNGFVSLNPMAVTLAQLRSSADDDVSADQQYGLGQTKYWLGWPSKFDDVLIVHFGEVLTDLPKPLELIAVGSVANLYRVKPP